MKATALIKDFSFSFRVLAGLLLLSATACNSVPPGFTRIPNTPEHKAEILANQKAHQAEWKINDRKDYFAAHPGLSPSIVSAINEEKIILGMDEEQVRLSLGEPEAINESVGSYGRQDQWVYGSSQSLYFKNGILDSWQRFQINAADSRQQREEKAFTSK
jgi:hypothetical protein